MNLIAEYIWIDGTEPTPHLRSKTRIIPKPDDDIGLLIHKNRLATVLKHFPVWSADGSSTNQATGYFI